MKTSLTILLCFGFILSNAQAEWRALGPDDFNQASMGPTNFNSDAVDSNRMAINNGIVYLMNLEGGVPSVPGRYVLNIFNGIWDHIETPFTSSDAFEICVDASGQVYFMFFDGQDANKLKLLRYENNVWTLVGGISLSDSAQGNIQLALDTAGLPVVMYREPGQTVLKRFDGMDWISIPASDLGYNGYLKIDSSNQLYVAYGTTGNQTIVKKYNGSFWEETGITGFANAPTALCLQNDLPVVSSGQAIRKFNGTGWEILPSVLDYYGGMRLFVNASNELYISYTTTSLISKRIQKFNGVSWSSVKYQSSYGPLAIAFDGDMLYEQFTKTDNYPLVLKQVGNDWFYLGHQTSILAKAHDLAVVDDYPWVSYSKAVAGQQSKLYISSYSASGSWSESPPISESVILNSRICKDNLGNVYVAYLNDINSSYNNPDSKVTVKKFAGGVWEMVGGLNFSLEAGKYLDLKFNNANEPHVIYESGRVQKFNGTAWELVGGSAFNGDLEAKMAFSLTDELYVIHPGVSVKKRNGNGWELIDSATLSAYPNATLPQILFDSDDLWIAFLDVDDNIHVMKNVSGTWIQIGNTIPTQSGCSFIDFKMDNNHVPTILYNQRIDVFRDRVSAKFFDGSSWVSIGDEAFSVGTVNYGRIAFANDNTPLATFSSPNGLYAKYFGEAGYLGMARHVATASSGILIYPNPVRDILTIKSPDPVRYAEVFDLAGKKIFKLDHPHEVDVSSLKPGIYFISVTADPSSTTLKFIKK